MKLPNDLLITSLTSPRWKHSGEFRNNKYRNNISNFPNYKSMPIKKQNNKTFFYCHIPQNKANHGNHQANTEKSETLFYRNKIKSAIRLALEDNRSTPINNLLYEAIDILKAIELLKNRKGKFFLCSDLLSAIDSLQN